MADRSTSLRVSVLEQCPYHCPYCLPGSVTPPVEKARWLLPEHHAQLAPLLRARGVKKVRFTGGEPLLRPDLPGLVAAWREHGGGAELALTTNGQRLRQALPALVDAGLSRVTVHIDTLRDDRYPRLMGNSSPGEIIDAVRFAQERVREVKLNVVVQRGQNDDEIPDFLALSQQLGVQVRFIELMNTGSAPGYTREVFLSGAEIRKAAGDVVQIGRRHKSDPAALSTTKGGVVFGVIASDSEPFCDACDRLRLTADGRLRGCLYQPGGVPIGAALLDGAPLRTIEAMIDGALTDKRSYHPLHRDGAVPSAPFSMADVGG